MGTDSVNAVLEAAAKSKLSYYYSVFKWWSWILCRKRFKTSDAAVLGGISGANHVHTMAKAYGIPVILHTDHAAKNFYLGLMDY